MSDHGDPVSGPSAEGDAGDRTLVPERRLFFIRSLLACLVVALALLLGVVGAARRNASEDGPASVSSDSADGHIEGLEPTIEMFPTDVFGFQTSAVQQVPGFGERASEAIYTTMDMSLELAAPTAVYARVEGFSSASQASQYIDSVYEGFPLGREQGLLNGVTPARIGVAPDEGARVACWTSGRYAFLVRAFFRDQIPAQKRDFLERQGGVIARAIEIYRRTGRQGVEVQQEIQADISREFDVDLGENLVIPESGQ